MCCVRVSLIPTSPLSAILVLASSRHSDAWVGSDVCKLEHRNEKSTLSVVTRFQFKKIPEVMIVSEVCMLLIVANAQLTKWLASRFYHTAVCCGEWKGRSRDKCSMNGFTVNVHVLICLVSVHCFTRGGKRSFLAQVLSTVVFPSFLRLHKACLVWGPVIGRSSRAFQGLSLYKGQWSVTLGK